MKRNEAAAVFQSCTQASECVRNAFARHVLEPRDGDDEIIVTPPRRQGADAAETLRGARSSPSVVPWLLSETKEPPSHVGNGDEVGTHLERPSLERGWEPSRDVQSCASNAKAAERVTPGGYIQRLLHESCRRPSPHLIDGGLRGSYR